MPAYNSHVQWQRISKERFEEIVEALLVRYHQSLNDGSIAEALDGRGGDGGRDVDAHVGDDLTVIYQLKHFPEGFSGGFSRSRKPQIRRSFEEAMEDRPPTWILVLPRNVTPTERKWVRDLRKRRQVHIETWGPARLNAELAKFPDLAGWAVRTDEVIDIFKTVGQEQAALLGPNDLAERVQRLRALASARSPYWDTKVSMDPDGTVIQELVAKRPDAPEREPINLDVKIDLQALEPAEREKWERLNDYGIGEVTIGGRALESFAVRGPEWIAGEHVVQRLEARSLFRGSKPISVLAYSGGPTPVASVEGAIVSAGPGSKGIGLAIQTPGGLTLAFLISTAGADGSIELQFNPARCDARAAKRTLDFVTSLDDGSRIELRQGTTTQMSADVTTTGERPGDAFVHQLIDDLAFISTDTHIPIIVPDSLSAAERLEIRRLRLILDGYAVLEPEFGTLSVTLIGESSPEFENRLSEGFALALTTDEIAYGFLGHKFRLQDLCVFHPQVQLEDAATIVEALRSGQAAGMAATIRPISGGPFWAYLPERMERLGRPRRPIKLDVPGHSEPPLPELPEADPQA